MVSANHEAKIRVFQQSHSAFLLQRVDHGAYQQSERSGGDAEGHSRTGRSCRGAAKGRASGGEVERDEMLARECVVVQRLVDPRQHQCRGVGQFQPLGAVAARGATKDTSGRCVPGWQVGVDAGCGAFAPCRQHEVGHAPVSGHESPGRTERSRMNARTQTFGSPSGEPNITTRPKPQQKCE